MNKTLFFSLINLLQGASWALAMIIATYLFFHTLSYGFISAVFSAFFGSLIGLFFVAFFELVNIEAKKFEESKKQTEILNQILFKLQDKRE